MNWINVKENDLLQITPCTKCEYWTECTNRTGLTNRLTGLVCKRSEKRDY